LNSAVNDCNLSLPLTSSNKHTAAGFPLNADTVNVSTCVSHHKFTPLLSFNKNNKTNKQTKYRVFHRCLWDLQCRLLLSMKWQPW